VGVTILKTSLFLKDYREIVLRLSEANPDAGERFCDAVEAAFKLLSEHPQIGRVAGFSSAPRVRRRLLHGARNVPPLIPNE
jgi:plasmid stabilization system protein ParE